MSILDLKEKINESLNTEALILKLSQEDINSIIQYKGDPKSLSDKHRRYYYHYYGEFAKLADEIFYTLEDNYQFDKHNGKTYASTERVAIKDVLKKGKYAWPRLVDVIDYHKYVHFSSSKTIWIEWLARVCGVTPAVLWTYNKAGKLYNDYYTRKSPIDKFVVPLRELKVAAVNLTLIDRIAGSDKVVADSLIYRLTHNQITNAELKKAWDSVKDSREKAGLQVHKKNALDEGTLVTSNQAVDKLKVVHRFSDSSWLKKAIKDCEVTFSVLSSEAKRFYKYQTIPGLQVGHDTMDLAIIENMTIPVEKRNSSLRVHSLVIKSFLDKDFTAPKEYDNADYHWLVVPYDVYKLYQTNLDEHWGLITYNRYGDELFVKQQATAIENRNLEPTLIAAILRMK